jgi:hypothetical protein
MESEKCVAAARSYDNLKLYAGLLLLKSKPGNVVYGFGLQDASVYSPPP